MTPIVAVLGAGNGGRSMAADLTLRGFNVRLYDKFPTALKDLQEQGGITLHQDETARFVAINLITADLKTAMEGAEIIFVVVPATAHQDMVDALTPHLINGQTVVFTPGYLASVMLRNKLTHERPDLKVRVAETASLPYACRIIGPAAVGLRGVKVILELAAMPAEETDAVLETVQPLFPILVKGQNVLEVSLQNTNPISHVSSCVLNFGRMESQQTQGWEDFSAWTTPGIASYMLRVDAERVAIATHLNCMVLDRIGYLKRAYGSNGKASLITAGPIPENAMAVPARYVTEDVPMGFVLYEALARLVEIPTPAISAMIDVASILFQEDYRQTGRNLTVLGWEGLGPDQILRQVS